MSRHARSLKYKTCTFLSQANEAIHQEIEKVYNHLLNIEQFPSDFEDVDELFGNSGQLSLSFYEFMQKDVKAHYSSYIQYLNTFRDMSLSMNASRTEKLLDKVFKCLKWTYESYYQRFDAELCVHHAIKVCHYSAELYKYEKKILNLILRKR